MEEIKEMFKHIKEKMDRMDTKLDNVIKENEQIKSENAFLRKQNDEQEKRLDELEKEMKLKNLIIKGIKDRENESYQETALHTKTLLEKIGILVDFETDVEESRRLGRYIPTRTRPILLKLNKVSKKREILSKTKQLKGTDIWIEQDYSKKVQEQRKALVPQLKEARQNGCRAYLKYDKLIVNNEVYHAGNLENGEQDVDNTIKENYKRTINDRSPENYQRDEQMRKIRNTGQKN